MARIKVYVSSAIPSPTDYADMKSLEHPCSQAGDRAYEGLRHLPHHSSGLLSDEELKAIDLVEQFSKEKGLEYEIIDLASAKINTKLKFVLKRWKVPLISCGDNIISGLPTRQQLESILK